MNPVIETKNLSKIFNIGTRERLTLFSDLRYRLSGEYPTRKLHALNDINIKINKGEMTAIIGPNGAGKTTLLRILAGIMAYTSGSMKVREEVSCIFELGLGFNPRFTAIENVYLYGALHGLTRREMDLKLPGIVEFSELGEFMGAKLSEFSSGMRARLAFATVIETLKGIVMIDEILAVGDVSFQEKCSCAIDKMLEDGNTILYITHGLDILKKYNGKALYLDGGNQMAFGEMKEVAELYERNIMLKKNEACV